MTDGSGLDPRHADRFRSILADVEAEAAQIHERIAAGDAAARFLLRRMVRVPGSKALRDVSLETPEGRQAIALDRLAKEIAQLEAVDHDLDDRAPAISNGRSSRAYDGDDASGQVDSLLAEPPAASAAGGTPSPSVPPPGVRAVVDAFVEETVYIVRRLRERGLEVEPAAVLETARIFVLSGMKSPRRARRRERSA